MKKTKTAFLLPFLLLTACDSYDESAFITETREALGKIEENNTRTSGKATPEGHVLKFNEFLFSSTDTFNVPTLQKGDNGYDFGSSYALHAPLRINQESYYPNEGDNDTGYSYASLSFLFNFSGDPIHHLSFQNDGENYVFSVQNVSKECRIGYVKTDENLFEPKDMKIYARFDLSITYDKYGFLIDELIKTQGASMAEKKDTVYYHVTYQYQ